MSILEELRIARDTASENLGRPLSGKEFFTALPIATQKLGRIIEREGDADGQRNEPWYLGTLVAEAIREQKFIKYIKKRPSH